VAEPFFNRAKLPQVITGIEELVRGLLADALTRESIEIVRQFAIPLQSRALARLLNMPDSEAEIWIGWGTHIFREATARRRAPRLRLIDGLYDRGEAGNGEDFFSALTRASFRGRKLTREEMLGYGSIMFAGGRDTVINSISGIIGHLSANPADLEYLREDQKRIVNAGEEFFRAISPVTHLGRVCPAKTDIHGVSVEPGSLVSLCFASANYDETVFDAPEVVRLDRKPNRTSPSASAPPLPRRGPRATGRPQPPEVPLRAGRRNLDDCRGGKSRTRRALQSAPRLRFPDRSVHCPRVTVGAPRGLLYVSQSYPAFIHSIALQNRGWGSHVSSTRR